MCVGLHSGGGGGVKRRKEGFLRGVERGCERKREMFTSFWKWSLITPWRSHGCNYTEGEEQKSRRTSWLLEDGDLRLAIYIYVQYILYVFFFWAIWLGLVTLDVAGNAAVKI